MFQLTDGEKVKVVTICDQFKDLRFSYQNPYAFVAMHHALPNYNQLFTRIENIELLRNRKSISLSKRCKVVTNILQNTL